MKFLLILSNGVSIALTTWFLVADHSSLQHKRRVLHQDDDNECCTCPTANFIAWRDILIPISGEEALTNRTSPQYLAAQWISNEPNITTPIGSARGLQRYYLAVFYFALDGDNWAQCGRLDPTCIGGNPDERAWLSHDENECDWLGVRCDDSLTNVTSIFFARQAGNNLKGYVPPETAMLTGLEGLVMQRNQLMGTIPAFLGQLTRLNTLFLLGNWFEGQIPEQLLTGAAMLGTIHVGENYLTGTIPDAISELPLQSLQMYSNAIEGSIPTNLGDLTLLTHLELYNNSLTGPLPDTLYNISGLTRVRLSQNAMTGSISDGLGDLRLLEDFRVDSNLMTGSIPTHIYDLPRIIDFRVNNNSLTGTLSENLGLLNSTLRRLWLSDNNMNGPLPITGIEKLTNLNELILHGNQFTGTITQLICDERGGRFFDLFNLTMPPQVICECCNLQV